MKTIDRESNTTLENIFISAGVSPLLANILSKREIKSLEELDMSMSKLLPPWNLLNITKASKLLGDAIIKKKFIVVVADFDADGATGCAVAILGLKKFNANVDFIVPDRFTFGYGLTSKLVNYAVEKFEKTHNTIPELLLTVDNGISSHEGVLTAKKFGIKVLITDHHLPGKKLPDALIVNPQQPSCKFESKNIAGVGVIFYLLIATRVWLREESYFANTVEPKLDDLLSLVALGTIADLVPLDLNNRRIVSQGIKRFKLNLIPEGLKALLKISNIIPENLICSDLGFKIAPKLNAAGRLSDMTIGIRCLIEENEEIALKLASQLEELNKKRKDIEITSREEGINLVLKEKIQQKGLGIVLFKKSWHQGIVGLIASKVKDIHTKPTIAFAYQDEKLTLLKGSGRSIKGIHLRDVLERISMRDPNLINTFGGHAMAAGITIDEKNLNDFKISFNNALSEFDDKSIFSPVSETDGKLDLKKININFVKELENSIWGQSFSTPLFRDEFTIHQKKLIKEKHLKLIISQTSKQSDKYEAVWFDAPEFYEKKISVIYELSINRWLGNEKIQVLVKDFAEFN